MANNTAYPQIENKQMQTNLLPKISFENRYERYIIDATDKVGDYIVENAVDEMDNLGIDATIFDGELPSIAEVSETQEVNNSYVYNIRTDELKKVANNKEAFDGLKDRIYWNLDQQERKDCYRRFPILLSKNGDMKATQKQTVASATDYAQILLDMLQDIRDLRKPTDEFNAYSKQVQGSSGPETKTLKTFADKVTIFVRADLLDEIMVKFESGVFNLEKISLDADIVPVNTFYTDESYGLVVANGTVDYSKAVEDPNKLWLACGYEYVKIYKHYQKYTTFEDLRNDRVGKAVDFKEYLSKLVPAKLHSLQA